MLLDKIDKQELKVYPNEAKCKLGFLDSVLRKWFSNPFTDDGKKNNILFLIFSFSFNLFIVDLEIKNS